MTEHQEFVRRFFEHVYSGGQIEVVDEIFLPAALYRGPINFVDGVPGIKAWLTEWRDAFAGTTVTVDYCLHEAERSVCRVTIRAAFQAELRGVAPTGRKFVLPAMFSFRFEQGRIAEVEAFYDTRNLAEQLGTELPPSKRFTNPER